jgi:hypothetical protein
MLGVGFHGQQALQLIGEDVIADAVGMVQARARNLLQALAELAVQLELARTLGRRNAQAQLVVETAVAILGGVERLVAGIGIVILVGQLEQGALGGDVAGGRYGSICSSSGRLQRSSARQLRLRARIAPVQ